MDDDEGQSFEDAYTAALGALGYTNVDVYTVPRSGSPSGKTGPDAVTTSLRTERPRMPPPRLPAGRLPVADADFNHRPVGQADTPYASVPTIELDPAAPAHSSTGQRWSSALIPRTGAVAGLRGGL